MIMAWLRRLFDGRSKGPRVSKDVLNGYNPYRAPFSGAASALTPEQAMANLDYLLTRREERLNELGRVLAPWGIDVEALIVEQYRKVPSPVFGMANELAAPVMNAISGAYERHWLEQRSHPCK